MGMLKLSVISPCGDYLDTISADNALAPRPATLDGTVVGLIPNWRPAAAHILQAIGAQLQERYRLKAVVMEPPVHISAMAKGGKLLGGIREQLADLARRVDVAIAATGD